jgi:hypothetical protein
MLSWFVLYAGQPPQRKLRCSGVDGELQHIKAGARCASDSFRVRLVIRRVHSQVGMYSSACVLVTGARRD